MNSKLLIIACGFAFYAFISCDSTPSAKMRQQMVGSSRKDTCDNPDANINCCFVNAPAKLGHIMNIAAPNEKGQRLLITGRIFKSDGKTPASGLVMYAYHTDYTGHYSKKGNETGIRKWHGYLHGWCKTDSMGYYEIHSIRPASYPGSSIPAHIHAALKMGNRTFYINDFVFKDDKLVGPKYLSSLLGVGGTGVVDVKFSGNTWVGKRDIVLKNQ